jgi:polyferredoxin
VRLKFKRAAFVAIGGLLVFVVLAKWLLWLMPPPHGRLQYMIAGTAATAAGLGTVFALVAIRKAGWAAKRRE